jgi:hypothetical protein
MLKNQILTGNISANLSFSRLLCLSAARVEGEGR